MASIGIVGAGTAGLHLGLKLLSHGIPVALYAEQAPATLRCSGRLPNTVAHHPPTRARERELGVAHWGGPQVDMYHLGIHVNAGPQSFGMKGRLEKPSIFVDYRLYHPKLAEDFVARGGRLEVLPVDLTVLEGLSLRHDLVVVATGRNGLTSLFPRIPELSPHTKPARLLFAALLKGVRPDEPLSINAHLVPGHGELFEAQVISHQGRVANLLVEALPEGELAVLSTQRYDEDPRAFEALLLDRLRRFAPATYARVDPATFGVLGPLDWVQGAFAPVVRRAWAPLVNGRLVMALGDTHVTNDPVAGQGANAASASAFVLAESILDTLRSERPFDEAFCRASEEKMWAEVAPATHCSNALLEPPPPHVVELLTAGSQDPRIADGIATAFMVPETLLGAFATPESAAAFIARNRTPTTESYAGPRALA
jgi:2-polyprenyl-6-methoxyphenol hydroxylase-like FAD-dependent oxidoreductase